jgi:hypothetical protein
VRSHLLLTQPLRLLSRLHFLLVWALRLLARLLGPLVQAWPLLSCLRAPQHPRCCPGSAAAWQSLLLPQVLRLLP